MFTDYSTCARYNAWANKLLHSVCETLSDEEYRKDRKAFFDSIHGTLNHIWCCDALYQDRLLKREPRIKHPRDRHFEELAALSAAQFELDQWFIERMDELTDAEIIADWPFWSVDDESVRFSEKLGTCLSNLFQHSVHHRGQTHNMLSQAGVCPPPLDFLLFNSKGRE